MPSDGKCNSGSGGNNKWGTAIKTSDIVDWHWHSGDVAAKVHLAANLPMFANATLSGGVGGHTSCCIRFMGCQIWRINDLRIWQWIYAHREPTAASKLAINIGFSNFLLPALNPYWITNRNNRLELFGFSFFRSYFHLCLLHLKCNYLRHASVKCRSTDCTNELKPELLQRGVAVFPLPPNYDPGQGSGSGGIRALQAAKWEKAAKAENAKKDKMSVHCGRVCRWRRSWLCRVSECQGKGWARKDFLLEGRWLYWFNIGLWCSKFWLRRRRRRTA